MIMAWFKVDDGLHASRKLLSIPRTVRLPALGLWTMAGSWSAHEELDGFIPSFMLKEWGGTPRLVRALVESGLWVPVEDGAKFHNWAKYQPTRAVLDAKRESERVRKAEYRERQRDGGVPLGHREGHQAGHQVVSEHPDPARPGPTRPDPLPTEERGGPTSPSCGKHPHWDHDDPCRACARDREAAEQQHQAEKSEIAADARRAARRVPQFCPHGFPAHEACERCGDSWPGR